MITLQLLCLAIVVVYITARLKLATTSAERRAFLLRFGILAIAATIGEDSVIRAYGTYAYASSSVGVEGGWSLFLDRVPLVVVLVWPVVIDSAAVLARHLVKGNEEGKRSAVRIAFVTSLIVLADASLIEPIAVHAKLWAWTDPGIFDVPLIGIAGWAMFTFAATWWLERSATLLSSASSSAAITIAFAPLATHALLQVTWWTLFRWTEVPIASSIAIAAAWGAALTAMATATIGLSRRIPRAAILLRAPGALFFFALLIMTRGSTALFAYAIAFAPAYLLMLARKPIGQAMSSSGALAPVKAQKY